MASLNTIALISGGKDSILNLIKCIQNGHKVIALANLYPPIDDGREIDSYMYQSVGSNIIQSIANSLSLPLFRHPIIGSSKNKSLDYEVTIDDEVENLFSLLLMVKKELPIEAVSCGAILSKYQYSRVNNVCNRLSLIPLTYLWQMPQVSVLDDIMKNSINAIIIKTACEGLFPRLHLNKTISDLYGYLCEVESKGLLNCCGEGGEYETLVLDCMIIMKFVYSRLGPLYRYKILIDSYEIVGDVDNRYGPHGYMKILKYHMEKK